MTNITGGPTNGGRSWLRRANCTEYLILWYTFTHWPCWVLITTPVEGVLGHMTEKPVHWWTQRQQRDLEWCPTELSLGFTFDTHQSGVKVVSRKWCQLFKTISVSPLKSGVVRNEKSPRSQCEMGLYHLEVSGVRPCWYLLFWYTVRVYSFNVPFHPVTWDVCVLNNKSRCFQRLLLHVICA